LGVSASPQKSDPLREFFERGKTAQAAMRSIRASFVETTISQLLIDPLVDKGTIVAAVRPIRLVMRYTAPENRTVWIDERTLAVQVPNRTALEVVDIAAVQRRVQKYFADASLDELRSTFSLTLRDDRASPASQVLEMTPTRRQVKEGLERLRIWVDRERLVMTRLEMDFPGGERKRIDLSNIEVNVPIDERTFARPGKSLPDGDLVRIP
jgi:outer membrane lipoprotein-sorting protein